MTGSPSSTLIVGSYAAADEPGIHVFTFDSGLRPLRSFAGVVNPSWVTIDRSRTHLYAVSEVGRNDGGVNGSVHAFRIDGADEGMDLVSLGHQSSAGDHPCHLGIHPGGRWVAVSNYGSGNVTILPILDDGSLGKMTATVRHTGSGPVTARQAGPHAHAGSFTGDGRWLVVADLGIDRLVIHAFHEPDGSLTPHAEIETAPGAGPRLLAFHGSRLFVVNELDSSLTMYGWSEGSARPLQTVSTVPDGVDGSMAAGLSVSTTGRQVYVTNRGHDSVAVFGHDPRDGLTLSAIRPCDGEWPRSCTVAPDGAHLLVANRRSTTVAVLSLVDEGYDVGPTIARVSVREPSSMEFR